MPRQPVLLGLDIGTSKVCAVAATNGPDGHMRVLGVGEAESHGLRKGVVVNIDKTIEAVHAAVDQVERSAEVEFESATVGIAGGHVRGFNSHGVTGVSRRDKEISAVDITQAVEVAKAVAMPLDREVLHVLPYGFVVDGQDGIKDPLGMLGLRLEAYVHIVTGGVTAAQNVMKSVNRAGLRVDEIALAPLAGGEAVLSSDEKDLGCVLVDIGAGTTDVLIYVDGSVRHSGVLPLGGDHVTVDISCGLRTPHAHAEDIKLRHAVATLGLVENGETIPVPSVGDRDDRLIPLRELVEIVEPRMDELLYLVRMEVHKSGYQDFLAGGAIFTGGGALLPGLMDMAEGIFSCPVRIGRPRYLLGDDPPLDHPRYVTACGLAQWRLRTYGEQDAFVRRGNWAKRFIGHMREWAGDLF